MEAHRNSAEKYQVSLFFGCRKSAGAQKGEADCRIAVQLGSVLIPF